MPSKITDCELIVDAIEISSSVLYTHTHTDYKYMISIIRDYNQFSWNYLLFI